MLPKHQSQENKVRSYKQAFSEDVSNLFAPGNKEGTRILTSFQRTARQLNIRNFDVKEILSEVTCKGLSTIDKKEEPIESVSAWYRSVGPNLIKDRVGAEIKARKLIEKHSFSPDISDAWVKLVLEEEGAAAAEAVELLSPEDQEIIRLRFIEGMSYKEIQAHYQRIEQRTIKVPTLRKRESRAVKRLRDQFKKIYKCE